MNLPEIYLIRHGQTEWNVQDRFQGLTDIPLNDKGRSQAASVGARLKTIIDGRSDLSFVSSPLSRAYETAQIISRLVSLLPLQTDDRLAEIHFGDFEGKTKADVRALHPDMTDLFEKNGYARYAPNSETFDHVCERVTSWLNDQTKPVVCVCHTVVIRAFSRVCMGYSVEESRSYAIPNDCIFHIKDGKMTSL